MVWGVFFTLNLKKKQSKQLTQEQPLLPQSLVTEKPFPYYCPSQPSVNGHPANSHSTELFSFHSDGLLPSPRWPTDHRSYKWVQRWRRPGCGPGRTQSWGRRLHTLMSTGQWANAQQKYDSVCHDGEPRAG